MSLGVLQFVMTRRYLGEAGLHPRTHDGRVIARGEGPGWTAPIVFVAAVAAIVALVWIGVIPMDAITLSRYTAGLIIAMAIAYFGYLLLFAGLDAAERKRAVVIIVLFIACALFWSGFEQAGSSLNLFAKRYVDRMVGGFEIPTGWFQSVQPAFVILFAPLFSALWVQLARRQLDPSAPLKFAFGLLLMGLGFLFMVAAANLVAGGASAPAYLLILTYLLTVFGELCVSPVGLSTVTKLAPARLVGQMMGVWFLGSSLGKLMAGLIAGGFDATNLAAMPDRFMGIVLYACGIGVFLLLISRPLARLMGNVR